MNNEKHSPYQLQVTFTAFPSLRGVLMGQDEKLCRGGQTMEHGHQNLLFRDASHLKKRTRRRISSNHKGTLCSTSCMSSNMKREDKKALGSSIREIPMVLQDQTILLLNNPIKMKVAVISCYWEDRSEYTGRSWMIWSTSARCSDSLNYTAEM